MASRANNTNAPNGPNRKVLAGYIDEVDTLLRSGTATEHSYRPCLKQLLDSIRSDVVATNEPKQSACGAPDFVLTKQRLVVGYVEAKEPGANLVALERGEQLKRYRSSLENLLFTDGLTFRWHILGELVMEARLGVIANKGNSLRVTPLDPLPVLDLLQQFAGRTFQKVKTAEELAQRLAGLARAIRETIVASYTTALQSSYLDEWRSSLAAILIADLAEPNNTPKFADMIAQTLAYGLFSARVMQEDARPFTRDAAKQLIPKSNPFLRSFFYQITSPDLDAEPFAPFVDDLVTVLANADMPAILAGFGRRTGSDDPIVHFYETFLTAYDPDERELRGVYFTPPSVVSYLVNSADWLLRQHFGCPDGLADNSKLKAKPGSKRGGKKAIGREYHKVVVLDPACGTGTFLYEVIRKIRENFISKNNAGLWQGYIKNDLLPRIFGFELLMAPYAVAHFKLGLELLAKDMPISEQENWAYHHLGDERLGVYLTNALEPPHHFTGMPLFTQWLAKETNSANEIKDDAPILVVIGNPPYSNFGRQNRNDWILGLLDDYKKGLGERKLNLDDDYIKFIRLAHEKIAKNGKGIIAFVTNNSFTRGLVHRRMRESLRDSFDAIYVLNLHGDSIIGEVAPDGSSDRNVFDIRQGVAATIFVKHTSGSSPGRVYYADLWGDRQSKYDFLRGNNVSTVNWTELSDVDKSSCLGTYYFFKPTSSTGIKRYCAGVSLSDVFSLTSSGIQTKRDDLFIERSEDALRTRMRELLTLGPTDAMKAKYPLKKTSGWSPERLSGVAFSESAIRRYAFRPYDWRFIYYDPSLLGRARTGVSKHLDDGGLALAFLRQTVDDAFRHVLVTDGLTDINLLMNHHVSDRVAPLYLKIWEGQNVRKIPNFQENFPKIFSQALGLEFLPSQSTDRGRYWGPEDFLAYSYAVLWSPAYRSAYRDFMEVSFPRVPLVTSPKSFWSLVDAGRSLMNLHLLRSIPTSAPSFPVAGDNLVENVSFIPVVSSDVGTLHINSRQRFEDVTIRAWEYRIGCYQVVDKWLKDRKGTTLTPAEVQHIVNTMGSLEMTLSLLDRIDATVLSEPTLLG